MTIPATTFQPLISQMRIALTDLNAGFSAQTVSSELRDPVQAGMQDSSLAEPLQGLHSLIERSAGSEISRDQFVSVLGQTITELLPLTNAVNGTLSAQLKDLHLRWSRLSESLSKGAALQQAARPYATTPPSVPTATPAKRVAVAQEPARVDLAAAILAGGIALVVDDREDVRSLIARMLERMFGFQKILQAENADEAWAILQKRGAEIVLMFTDIDMPPGINGIELARRSRSLYPDMPIVIASGLPMDTRERDDELFIEWSTGISFIQKPFQPPDLKKLISSLT